jgi:hypothetical protein
MYAWPFDLSDQFVLPQYARLLCGKTDLLDRAMLKRHFSAIVLPVTKCWLNAPFAKVTVSIRRSLDQDIDSIRRRRMSKFTGDVRTEMHQRSRLVLRNRSFVLTTEHDVAHRASVSAKKVTD